MNSSFHSDFSAATDASRYLAANNRYGEKLSLNEIQKHLDQIKNYRNTDGETLLHLRLKELLFFL